MCVFTRSIITIETNANDEQLAKAKLCIERILKHISGSQSKYKYDVKVMDDIVVAHPDIKLGKLVYVKYLIGSLL